MSYISFSIYKLKLDQIDAYDDKDYQLKLKRKSVFISLIFFIFERSLTLLIDYSSNTDHLSLIQLIVSPRANIIWAIGTISAGIIYYFRTKSKIKK